jgi:hypothetical protein
MLCQWSRVTVRVRCLAVRQRGQESDLDGRHGVEVRY